MFHRITRAPRSRLRLAPRPIAAQESEIIRAHGYSFYGNLSYPPISRISTT